ncbi:hypothetical protein EON63_11905 [archaeon]|nr:MAG: hypothetical protein EON63_11905 [archaeon]
MYKQLKTTYITDHTSMNDINTLLHTLSLHTPCSPAAQALENRHVYERHVSFCFDEDMRIHTIIATNV